VVSHGAQASGAGAAISPGSQIRALTAKSAAEKSKRIKAGSSLDLKNAIKFTYELHSILTVAKPLCR